MADFLTGKITDVIGSRGGHHKGVDIAVPSGTPVTSPYGKWVVEQAGWYGGYGKKIGLRNEATGERMYYGHLNDIFVKTGQRLRERQMVGLSGSTGKSTGPHVHLEARGRMGDIKNPLEFYSFSKSYISALLNTGKLTDPITELIAAMKRLSNVIGIRTRDIVGMVS